MAGSQHRLRLLTMNVQLMTQDALLNRQAVEGRARQLVDAFLADRWPDVLCFNEVFDEGARAILVGGLRTVWPFVVERFGPVRNLSDDDKLSWATAFLTTIPAGHPLALLPAQLAIDRLLGEFPLPDDSGVMVFSRRPIISSAFVPYSTYSGTDSLADKGAAFVAIRLSAECTAHVIATHMQAAYDTQTEHRAVRLKQLDQIRALIEAQPLRDFATPTRVATVVCGDLNIQGAAPARPEWTDVFMNGAATDFYVRRIADGWDHYISPGQVAGNDPGVTNRDGVQNWDNRLDYVLLLDYAQGPVGERRPFAVQRMFLTHHGLSDHIALAAEINLDGRHRSPAFAKEMWPLPSLPYIEESLDEAGMLWLRFRGGGTWSFTSDRPTAFEVYSPAEMSRPYVASFQTDLRLVDHAADALRRQGHGSLEPIAFTFVVPIAEFYVRVFRRDDAHGKVRFFFCRHLGTSPHDPIGLIPQNVPVAPDWAALSMAGVNPPHDLWFCCQTYAARSGNVHLAEFEVANRTAKPLAAKVMYRPDPGTAQGEDVWAEARSAAPTIQLSALRGGSQRVLFQVHRDDLAQTDFAVRWYSAVSFLVYPYGDPPLLACKDETGIDVTGGDEITLEVLPDGTSAVRLIDQRQDVDTGETLTVPTPQSGGWAPGSTGFINDLTVRVIEDESVGGDDRSEARVPALARDQTGAAVTMTLHPGTGTYVMQFQLARQP